MEDITYHKATINDVQTLVDYRILFAIELSGKHKEDVVSSLRKQMTGYFSKAILENSCISFIAKSGDEIAGIGSLHIREVPGNFKNLSGKWGYIMNMYTIPTYRRKRICSAILNLLIEDAMEVGITAFELHATRDGEFVYVRDGFELHKEPTYRKYLHKLTLI